MTHSDIIKNTFRKFYVSTAVAIIGMAVMNLLNIVFANLFFGSDGGFTMGLALPVVIFTEITTYFFGIGGGIAVSIRQGRGEKKEANGIFTAATVSTLAAGIFIAVLGPLFLSAILPLLGAKTAAEQAVVSEYLRILFCGMPVILLCGVLNVFIRNDNNPRFAMMGALTSIFTNLILIGIFVGGLKLPVYSIALATVLSNAVCAVLYIGYFFGKKSTVKFSKECKLSSLKDICEPGAAGSMIFFAQTCLTILINNVLQNISGAPGIAAYGIVKYAITFIYAIYDSVNHSAQPMFGVYTGERDPDGIRQTAGIAYRFILMSSVVLCVLLTVSAPFLSKLFALDVTAAVRIIGISCLCSSTVAFLNSYYRATEKSRLSLYFIVLDNLILPAILIYIMVYRLQLGQVGIWLSLLLAEALTLLIIAAVTKGKFLLLGVSDITEDQIYQTLIVNDEANIISINEDIAAFCDSHDISTKKQYYIFLCIEEIAVNIIKYGFQDGKEHYIDIRIVAGEQVILNIRDDAVQFDPTVKTDADITTDAEERDIGGLGIYLVKKVAKEFNYKRVIGFNNLHIVL